MTLSLIVFFMGVALVLYTVFGGADFGAGIWECFTSRRDRARTESLVNKAIGPVWEANHVWLILVIVILFNAFPEVHRVISIHFHIPLSLVLLGITLRGTAFVCRYYDAIRDDSQKVYAWFFRVSSLLTPFMLGVCAAGLVAGVPATSTDYADAYLWPWFNLFGAAVGLFACSLFAYVAAVFLIGESDDQSLRDLFRRRALQANLAAVLTGGMVFIMAHLRGVPLLGEFFDSPVSLGALLVVSLLAVATHWLLKNTARTFVARVLVSGQVTLILLGWFASQYPVLLRVNGGENLTLTSTLAPTATQTQMLIALLIGAVLIFPSLGYLFFVFKIKTRQKVEG